MTRTWVDVADAVTKRRLELEMTQQQAVALSGLSPTTWQKLESRHEAPIERSLHRMAKALRWRPDFAELILQGSEPVEVSDAVPVGFDGLSTADVVERIAGMEAELAALRSALEGGSVGRFAPAEGDDPDGGV